MLHQLPGAFTLTAGHTQLKLPDITHQRGNTFRDRQRATAFVQHVVCRQRERIIIGETALLGNALRRFQQRIPEHGREQERRIHAHIVMNTGIRVLQHLCNHPLHCAVTVFGEVAGNGREQRLEQVVFTQQIVGFKPVACLEQL